MRSLLSTLLVLGTAFLLCACTTNRRTGPAAVGAMPLDLPDNPDPCAVYCKEWVPPVYRKVPRLRVCEEGHMVPTEFETVRTRFEDVQVQPRRTVCRVGCGETCEESLVQVRPGGFRWVQTPGGCWKYEYCKPQYKWCDRTVTSEGIEYCAEHAPVYETVAHTERVTRVGRVYKPATYEVVYEDELYTPGHWRWVARYDTSGTSSCGCRPVREVVVERKCKPDCVAEGCARCN